MNNIGIGIATSMYNYYDTYLLKWVESIVHSSVKPDMVVICQAGKKYKIERIKKALFILKDNKIKYNFFYIEFSDMGTARNKAVENLNTKWIMYLDVDDELMKNGLKYLSKFTKQSTDIIVGGLLIKENNKKTKKFFGSEKYSKTELKKGKWLNSHSLFKSELLKRVKYSKTEYCNNFFWTELANTTANFMYIDYLITIYNKRVDSHSEVITKSNLTKWKRELKKFLKVIKDDHKK